MENGASRLIVLVDALKNRSQKPTGLSIVKPKIRNKCSLTRVTCARPCSIKKRKQWERIGEPIRMVDSNRTRLPLVRVFKKCITPMHYLLLRTGIYSILKSTASLSLSYIPTIETAVCTDNVRFPYGFNLNTVKTREEEPAFFQLSLNRFLHKWLLTEF